MTDQRIAAWHRLGEQMAAPAGGRFQVGPWSGNFLAPTRHATSKLRLEALGPRLTAIDYAAYMSSIDHINHSLGWDFPRPDLSLDDAWLDMQRCWVRFGRNEAFDYGALDPVRDEEFGCIYLRAPVDATSPYEAALSLWVVERGIATDLDLKLLEATVAWFETDWPFDCVVHFVPNDYRRGADVATMAGFRPSNRQSERPNMTAWEWRPGRTQRGRVVG